MQKIGGASPLARALRRSANDILGSPSDNGIGRNLSLLDWMLIHRRSLIPDRSFDLSNHRYLRGIYECDAREAVLFKAGQVGISEYLISYALHACDMRGATTLYVFPTDGHVSDFSAARMGPAIEASEYLQSIIEDGSGSGGKRGSDKVTLKRVRDRFLYFRGGHVKKDGKSPGLKSVDADLVIVDEIDECDPRVLGIVDKRLGHSEIAEKRYASTPTYAGVGIHALWMLSDQRRWFVPCPACGCRQSVEIGHCVTEWDANDRPAAWHQNDGEPFFACRKCHRPLDMLVDGEWVPEFPEISLAGFHVQKFFSSVLNLPSIIRNLQSMDETTRRETYNQDLGLTYTPTGGSLTDGDLDECIRDYRHGPDRSLKCYMGIDVGSVLHVVVRQERSPETGEYRQLFAGESSWGDIGFLITRYAPVSIVIDALPETTKARELQSSLRSGQMFLCYYPGMPEGSKAAEPAAWDKRKGVVNADRTRTLDRMLERVYDAEATIPRSIRETDYYSHMKSIIRVVEAREDRSSIARYIKSGADHYAHAENYCYIAMSRPIISQMA